MTMGTELKFVRYVCDQIQRAGPASYQKMFGEYAVRLGDKVVALAIDNRLFVKPTTAGRTLLGKPVEEAPFKGAKLWFAVDEQLEDASFMADLIGATWSELPEPAPKKAKKPPLSTASRDGAPSSKTPRKESSETKSKKRKSSAIAESKASASSKTQAL
jgi:TfoX/Sxy family transcriptional regulator of competence genes